jgi:putative ABC transport system permease protein
MFDKDNWQEIFATIKKNKLRTFLTSLGVGWGIFMLVLMLGAGNGLKNGVMQDFNGFATNSFFVWAQKTGKAYKGMQPGRSFHFNNSDMVALSQVKEFDVICPQNHLGGRRGGNTATHGLKTGVYDIVGFYPNLQSIQPVFIKKGRFLNQLDVSEKRKVCIIGKRVKEELFTPDDDPLGKYIRISGVYFKVIGFSEPTGNGEQARQQSGVIYVPFTTFQTAFNYGDVVGNFCIRAPKMVSIEKAEKTAIALLKERHKIAPEDELAIGHWNMGVQYGKISGLFTGINALIWFVGIGTLLAGVIGISNIMLIVVKERTREIGVKRALGATPANVIAQIMMESVFLTLISGYLGLISGLLLLEGINSVLGPNVPMFKNPTIDLTVTVQALAVLVVSGAIAGLIPALKAVSVNPVEALRAE